MTDDAPQSDTELLHIFRRFDSNSDGRIEEAEFRKILNELGDNSADEVLSLEFALIDDNQDGLVDLKEFVDWWRDYQ